MAMFGSAARTVWLVVAAWALLFAPGAARDDAHATGDHRSGERVAAAVIAPTFGSDSLLTGRPCHMGADRSPDLCQVDAAAPVMASPLVVVAGLAVRSRQRRRGEGPVPKRGCWSTRAPPRA